MGEAQPLRRDFSLSRSEWKAEFRRLFRSLLAEVYLKDPGEPINIYPDDELDFVFDHTDYTPAAFIGQYHSPHWPTNRVARGQKARVKRWKKWTAANGVECAWTYPSTI